MTGLLADRSYVTVGPMTEPYDFGARLSRVLDELGVSAEELGRRLNYATKGRSVRRWKSKATPPDMKNVLRIAEVLAIPVERLLPTPEQRARAGGDAAEDGP